MGFFSNLFGSKQKRTSSRNTQQPPITYKKEIKKKKISTHELQIGMRIIQLDRPWTDLPVTFQELLIKEPKDVKLIQKYCQEVYIDHASYQVHQKQPIRPLPKKIRYHDKQGSAKAMRKDLQKELPKAKQAFDKSQEHIKLVMQKVQEDGHININNSRKLVANCVTSILSNPNAMFWMSRIKDQDEYTAEHCLRVGILAIAFARHLQLAPEELELVGMCGMLHDVGKMKVPNSILNKPGALTAEEFAIIKEHTVLGYIFLKEHGGIDEQVCTAAYNHHESLNGKGYPRGLESSYLSLYDRIIAIVDSYDAMTSDRCYRKGMAPDKATAILYKESRDRYDEYLVKEFIKMVGVYPVGSFVQLNNGFYAIVLTINANSKLSPVVEIIADDNKVPLKRKIAIDLSKGKKHKGMVLQITNTVTDSEMNIQMSQFIETRLAS